MSAAPQHKAEIRGPGLGNRDTGHRIRVKPAAVSFLRSPELYCRFLDSASRTQGSGVLPRRSAGFSTAAALCLMAMAVAGVRAEEGPRGTAQSHIGAARVLVEYGRPWLRGRDVVKMLEPGQLWRLGADAPTTIQSETALNFPGARIPAGKHILLVRYIRPGTWSLVFSTSAAIDYTPGARIAETLMHLETGQASVQQLTIRLFSRKGIGRVEISWGPYRLSATFAPAR